MGARLAHLDQRCRAPGADSMRRARRDAGPLDQPAAATPIADDVAAPPPTSAGRLDWTLPRRESQARSMSLSSGWSFPAAADYAPAAPSLSLGAPVTLVADEPTAPTPKKALPVSAAPIDDWHDSVAAPSPATVLPMPSPDPVDDTWAARLSGQTVSTEPLAEGQSAAGHDIFDRMGRSRQQTLAFSLGRFDIDEHLQALETALSVDARLAAGQSVKVDAEAARMGDFDLLSEIASLTAEHAAIRDAAAPPVEVSDSVRADIAPCHAQPTGPTEPPLKAEEEVHEVTIEAERIADAPPHVDVTVDGQPVDTGAPPTSPETKTRSEETKGGDKAD